MTGRSSASGVRDLPKGDISYASPEGLRLRAAATDGYTPMFVNAKVVADTDGEVAALVEAIVANAGARAWDDLDELYDDYLNCFFRSLKAWRRGDGSADGCRQRTRASVWSGCSSPPNVSCRPTTISCERRCASSSGRRGGRKGSCAETLTRVLATGDPTLQQALELRVEALFESRGIGHQWGPEDGLDIVKAHRFE